MTGKSAWAAVIGSIIFSLAGMGAEPNFILEPPGKSSRPKVGEILINGRRLSPTGRTALTDSYAWGLAISPNESRAALLTTGAVEILTLGDTITSERFPPYGRKMPLDFGTGAYMGLAFSPDGKQLLFGSANEGQVLIWDIATKKLLKKIDIDGGGYKDSFLGDFVLTSDGRFVYGCDQFNYRVVEVDLQQDKVLRSVRVGRNPFGIRLAPDGESIWVSNVGMFEYPLIPGVKPGNVGKAGLSFPAYGVPSPEAEKGVTTEGIKVPGLGSLNHPDAMSVFRVDRKTFKVTAKLKTGYLVGARRGNIQTVGGASPATVAVGREHVYVTNATNDTVSVISMKTNEVLGQIELLVPGLETLRGILPFGIAVAPDERTAYVACAGLNAVGVLDLARRECLGYIPSGWFCSFVRMSRDGKKLYVASAKGVGSGPNGGAGFVAPARGTHPGDIMRGLFQIIDLPKQEELARHTGQVVDNTYRRRQWARAEESPLRPKGGPGTGPIRHVVFIVKENRTFDQVFGDRTNCAADRTLCELGLNETIRNDAGQTLEKVAITPNHHALADRFAMSDNFYCDSDQSNTGHRWVVGVYPNEWVEVNARSRIEERIFSTAPGRRYVNGSSATMLPEDYNEAGALWEHLARHQVSFFNFGFGMEMPASIEEAIHKYTGNQLTVSFPLPKPLFDHTSRKFATFNMAIPDQFRVDMFEEELRDRWLSGKQPFPRLITMVLPNDHMTRARPAAGYPFEESYVADNDLALARVVARLSRTRWWKEMLIVVVEDDPQGGRDHVDAHRSLCLLISPYVRRAYVSHALLSFGSIIKLIEQIVGLPHLNQFDATAALPEDAFTDRPDFEPYPIRPVDRRLFDPEKAFKPFDRRFDWKAVLESPEMDDPDDMHEYHERKAQ